MNIEFQVNTTKLFTGVTNNLRTIPICIPNQFLLDLAACPGLCMFDRILFPEDAFLRFSNTTTPVTINVPGGNTTVLDIKRLQIAQPLSAPVVQLSQLENSNTAATNPCFTVLAKLLFDLTADTADGGAELCITFAGIESAIEIPQDILDQIQSQVPIAFQTNCAPFDLEPLKSIIGGGAFISNAGISTDSTRTALFIRLEIDGPSPDAVVSWSSFFAGGVTDSLFGNDWSISIDKGIILPVLANRVGSLLNKYNEEHWFNYNLYWGPTPTWSNLNNEAWITIEFNGELEHACVCLLSPQDIEIEFHINAKLYVNQPNELTIIIKVDSISHDDFSILCCAQTNTLMWAFLGPQLLSKEPAEEFWGPFLGGMTHPPAVFIEALVMAGDAGSLLPPLNLPGATCDESEDDSNMTFCKLPFDMSGNPLMGSMTFTGVRGLPNGPLLTGSLIPTPSVEVPEINVTNTEFRRGWKNPCGTSELVNRASISILVVSNSAFLPPFELCEITVLDDPPAWFNGPSQFAPYFEVSSFSSLSYKISFAIPQSALSPQYLANPYNLRVLIQTSAGVRLVTIKEIKPLSAEENFDLNLELLNIKVTKCKQWSEWWDDRLFLPEWLPYPGPERVTVEHLWMMFVSQLRPGDSVGFRDTQGNNLGIAHSVEGSAQLSALVTPAANSKFAILAIPKAGIKETQSATMRYSEDEEGVRTSTKRAHLKVKQVLLGQASIVRLYQKCRHFSLGQYGTSPALLVTSQDILHIYSLRHPVSPRFSFQSRIYGIRGAVPWKEGILVWEDNGVRYLATNRDRAKNRDSFVEIKGMEDVHIARGYVFALAGPNVYVLDKNLSIVHVLKASGALQIAITGRTLLIANERGMEIYNIDQAAKPVEKGFYDMPGVNSLLRPILPNATDTVFAGQEHGGGVLLYFGLGQRPLISANFDSDPWFVNVKSAGKILGRMHVSRQQISIFVATFSATLPADERLVDLRT